MENLVDKVILGTRVRLVASYAYDWLQKVEKSSSSLTAAFYTAVYSDFMTPTIKELEKDLGLNPDNAGPKNSIAKRILEIKKSTDTLSLGPDDRWDYILPALKKLSDYREAESINPLRAAKALRKAVHQSACVK